MPLYHYTAIDKNGKHQPGTIEAPNEVQARKYLIEEHELEPIAIEEKKEAKDVLSFMKKTDPQTVVYFTRQLSTMLTAGVETLVCLEALGDQEDDEHFQKIIKEIAAKVEGGQPLSMGFSDHPEIFDKLFISIVRAGEESGHLPEALQELADQLEKQAKLRKAIKSAIMYPKIVVAISFVIISGLLIAVVPKFAGIYDEVAASKASSDPSAEKIDTTLPLITRIVTGSSELLYPAGEKNKEWILQVVMRFAILIGFYFLSKIIIRNVLKRPIPRARWDAYKLTAPMKIGPLIQKITVARFARTFSTLLNSGIPASEAMDIVADSSGNVIVTDAILRAQEQVLAGGTIAEPLEASGVFPLIMTRMIHVGEESGDLAGMLQKVADYFEEEVDAQVNALSELIQPVLMTFISSLIGVVIIALYLPMVGLYSKVA